MHFSCLHSATSRRRRSALLFLALLLFPCAGAPIRSARASGGEADISGRVDFARGELVRLDGDWAFYPDRLLSPAELGELEGTELEARTTPKGTAEAGTAGRGTELAGTGTELAAPRGLQSLVPVPSMWATAYGFSRPVKTPIGVATLRLRLKVRPGTEDWAIRLPNAYSAERLFVNGKEVAELGRVSERPESYLPSNGLAFPEFKVKDGSLDIVLQVANFSTPMIGTWDSPILGSAAAIRAKRQADVVSTSLISGALLIMGLYHLGLFILRKRDRASLLFGFICLLMTVRNHIMGERLLWDLFPASAAAWDWFFRIQLLSAHLTLPLFALFFKELFPREVRRWPVALIIAGGAVWAALVLLTPSMVYQRFLHWYEYFLVVAGFYLLGAITVAAFRRERGAILVALGIIVLLATSTNDVLLSAGFITNTFYMASYGVFLYLFVQSFLLSMIFSKAFRDVEELSGSLMQKNRELESLHTMTSPSPRASSSTRFFPSSSSRR